MNIDPKEAVVISQCTDDQTFGIPKKLLNNCIPKAQFTLMSSTVTIVVAVVVGAVYHSCTTFSTLQNSILIRIVSLEANLEKKSEQSKRNIRVHIIEAIKSLKAVLRGDLRRANTVLEVTSAKLSNPYPNQIQILESL